MQPVRARRSSSPKGVGTVTNATPEETGVKARVQKREAPAALVRGMASMSLVCVMPGLARRRRPASVARGRGATSTSEDEWCMARRSTCRMQPFFVVETTCLAMNTEGRAAYQAGRIVVADEMKVWTCLIALVLMTFMYWDTVVWDADVAGVTREVILGGKRAELNNSDDSEGAMMTKGSAAIGECDALGMSNVLITEGVRRLTADITTVVTDHAQSMEPADSHNVSVAVPRDPREGMPGIVPMNPLVVSLSLTLV